MVDKDEKIWKKFLSNHWKMFALWIVGAILAFIGAIYVFLWHVEESQLVGLVPETLGLWSMGHFINFVLHLIFWEELVDAIDSYDDWDEGWNFTGMGQFGRSISYLDSLIIAAGRTKKIEVLPSIIRLAEKLTPESNFSHFRAVAIALETIGDQKGAEPLWNLLQMRDMRGHAMTDIKKAKELEPDDKTDVSTRNKSLRELILGRALFKCGDFEGVGNQILNEYSKDLRGHYYRHASGVLRLFSDQKDPKIEL